MKTLFKYLKKTSFTQKKDDVTTYLELSRQARKLWDEAGQCSLVLIHSYNYYEEDRYPSCIDYIKANTDKGAMRGGQVCVKFSNDKVCDNVDCPAQAAQAKYVATRQAAKAAEDARKSFWSITMKARVK